MTAAASGAPRVVDLAALAEMAAAPVPERKPRKARAATPFVHRLTEADYQKRITDYAELRHWGWKHDRPARTEKGWRTPVSGPLGIGWPDLILIRPPRVVVLEVKKDGGRVSKAQQAVLDLWAAIPGVDALAVWPRDWDHVRELLA